MFEAFSRSWEITKLSFRVIGQDKEMILFPLLGGIFSLLFMAVMIIPSAIPYVVESTGAKGIPEFLMLVIAFVIYFGLSFIATFFNVCIVYTTKIRFSGGDATFMESISFASSRIHIIFAWSIVSATVGLILNIIDQIAERAGGIAEIVIHFIRSILGMMWSIITIFVVPGMVYYGYGPFEAIKQSVEVLKKTWGESLIRHYGLGMVQGLCILAGIIIGIPFLIIGSLLGPIGIAAVVALMVIYFVVVVYVFVLANSIFNTALFEYAATGKVPSGYTQDVLSGAFMFKEQKKRWF